MVSALIGCVGDVLSNAVLLVASTIVASFTIPTLVGLRFLFNIRRRFATHRSPRGLLVIVTGAASGFGRCLTKMITSQGGIVVAVDVDEAGLKSLKEECSGAQISLVKADLCNPADCLRIANTAKEQCRILNTKLYGLVNNAGTAGKPGATFEMTDAAIDMIFGVNILGIIRLTRDCYPLLNQGQEARVINVSSMAGYSSGRGMGMYSATKFSLEAYTDALRQEVPSTVKVVCINPYFAQTNIYRYIKDKSAASESVLQGDMTRFRDKLTNERIPGMMSCEYVTEFMYDGLYSSRPQDRYLIGNVPVKCLIEALAHLPNYFGIKDRLAVLLK